MSGTYKQTRTQPLPRADLAPISSRETDPDEPTKVTCPLCVGCRMVSPEIAAWFANLVKAAKENA